MVRSAPLSFAEKEAGHICIFFGSMVNYACTSWSRCGKLRKKEV